MKKKTDNKTIEQIDYELKAKKKFPPDESYPEGEQTKQKDNKSKRAVIADIDKKKKKK